MKYEKYLIKKGKLDLLSSLKALDKKVLDEKMEEYGVNDIFELKDFILDYFEFCLNESKNDNLTKMYFGKLINNENYDLSQVNEDDIESLIVFIYETDNHFSYYIPSEIKQIINKLLGSFNFEEQFNLEYAANTPVIKDLKALLDTLTISDLKNIGDLLLVNRLSNKPKKEIVKIIYSALTDKNKLVDLIERLIDKEFNLLKRIMKNKGTIQDNKVGVEEYHFLYMTGLVFIFKRENKFYISISNDIYKVIEKIDLKPIQKIVDENTKVYNLLSAMIELYGVVSYGDLYNFYNLYYGKGEELDVPDNALYFCDRVDNIDTFYIENNIFFAHKILKNKNLEPILENIVSRQKSIKKKPIELKELLKYSDSNYYEQTESKNEFKKYLKKKNIPVKDIEEILKIISDLFRLGNHYIMASIEMLQDYGIEVEEENLQEIVSYLINIYNNSRVWTNNGWTPVEMRKEYK